jgi:ornithine carbamoyltransferase
VPVVNAFSEEHHPCQALADLLTIQEEFGDLEGRKLGFVGDGDDNVAHSLLEAGALAGLDVTIGCPPGSSPNQDVLDIARRLAAATSARLEVTHDSRVAVAGADVVYADSWASRGDEHGNRPQRSAFGSYEVTEDLMRLARPTAIFLHSLPAKRGEEVATEVIDGPQSAVWRQSANRLPTEEAVLLLLAHGGAR